MCAHLHQSPWACRARAQERVRSPNDVTVRGIQQRRLTADEIAGAKEAFLTGSTLRVMPMVSINNQNIMGAWVPSGWQGGPQPRCVCRVPGRTHSCCADRLSKSVRAVCTQTGRPAPLRWPWTPC